MGAQRAPISSMKPAVVRRCERHNAPGYRGLSSPPKASSTRAHFPPVKRSPVNIWPSRLVLGNTSRGPRRDTVATPADAVRQPTLPCYVERAVFRPRIATAGWTGATVIKPGLNSS
jgi:hypothetical protein